MSELWLYFDVEFNVMAALQPAAGTDGVGEDSVPGCRAAQVPDSQGATFAGGRSHGATGKTAEIATEGTAVFRTRVSLSIRTV